MSLTLDRFMNDLRVRLPGATDDAIYLEVFNTLDEFCKETNAWQERIRLSVNSDHLEYEIEPEENRAIIVRLLWVTMATGEDENALSDIRRPGVLASLPRPDLIVFALPPSDEALYYATVALTVIDPVNTNTLFPEIPEWFLVTYSQDLKDGIISKMVSQPSKPYTSREAFLYHGRRFRNAISRVRIAVNHQNTYGTEAWRYPSFAQCRK